MRTATSAVATAASWRCRIGHGSLDLVVEGVGRGLGSGSLALATLLVALAITPSCGPLAQSCTLADCTDGLFVDFYLRTPGAYSLAADVDGQVVACAGSLPVDGTESCTGPGRVGFPWSGAPPNDQMIWGMNVDVVGAQSVHLMIARDGTTILDETFSPQWIDSAPNGVDCGPVCNVAAASFNVE